MKKILIRIALLILSTPLISGTTYATCATQSGCDAGCTNPKTTYLPRSQANNRAREMAGWYMNWQFDKVSPNLNSLYGSGSIAVEYSRSFRPNVITDYLFGTAAKNGTVYFSGSKVANRGTTEVLADYFGLPQDYVGRVTFDPIIQNIIVDMNAYFALDKWCQGLYVDVHLPLVNSRWGLNPCACTEVVGTASYEYGYMAKLGIDRSLLPTDPLAFWTGNATWGDMQSPLANAKVSCDTRTETKLADVHVYLGYDWCQSNVGHFGAYARASFPTGNRPTGEYLFEPIVGNGGNFELGGGINSQAILWENDRNHQFSTCLDVYISHLFNATQKRSFDFTNNGPGSRYVLLDTFKNQPVNAAGVIDINHIANVGLTKEYAGVLLPAANISTFCCQASTQLQAEFTLKFEYMLNNFTFDVGYNFWGKTQEKIVIAEQFTQNLYSIKGDAYLYGVRVPGIISSSALAANPAAAAAAQAGYPTNAIALSPTQVNSATLFTGGNYNPNRTLGDPHLNLGVDSPTNASATSGTLINDVVISPVPGTPNVIMKTSAAANIINPNTDFDPLSAAQPSQVSQKLFVNAAYTGKEREICCGSTIPYIGLGGEVEFGSKSPEINGSRCLCSGALSQWGVWLKGGFTY